MDQLEFTVSAHESSRYFRGTPTPVRRYLIYHKTIADQNFIKHVHNVISGLEDVVEDVGASYRDWLIYTLVFSTDGKTTLTYSGESSTGMWRVDDTLHTRTVVTPDRLPVSDVLSNLLIS